MDNVGLAYFSVAKSHHAAFAKPLDLECPLLVIVKLIQSWKYFQAPLIPFDDTTDKFSS